jgi:hypothetical protein
MRDRSALAILASFRPLSLIARARRCKFELAAYWNHKIAIRLAVEETRLYPNAPIEGLF